MSRICAVVAAGSPEAMASAARSAMSLGADMVELRLDHLASNGGPPTPADITSAIAAVGAAGVPLADRGVLSLRAGRDGGAYGGDEASRQELLHAVAGARAAWVDLEGWLPRDLVWALSAKARAAGSMVLVSWHVVGPEDPVATVEQACTVAKDSRADAVKLVVPVEGRADLDDWLGLSEGLSEEGVPHVLLPSGRLSRVGRLLAPLTETEWVYAEPGTGASATLGPLGLPIAIDLADAWRQSGMRPSLDAPAAVPPPMTPGDHGQDWTLLAILGDPVAHTMSPVLHHTAMVVLGMRGAYLPLRTPLGTVDASLVELEHAGARGCNVTVPLKVEAAHAVDQLGDAARLSGAVNTVVLEGPGGDRLGENTDAHGVRRSAEELLGTAGSGRTALILGTGGAARGAVVGLAGWGARVLVAGRDGAKAEAMAGALDGMVEVVKATDLDGLSGTVDLLVQCTSQGMHGVPPSGLLVPVVVMEAVDAKAVLDLVYSPDGTEVVRHARTLGLPAAGGERVLLHQAAAGFELWTGRKAPLEAMEAAVGAARGPVMPGSGPGASPQ